MRIEFCCLLLLILVVHLGASPAKFVSLDELMDMSAAMDNMALVHEIAINPNFHIPETSINPVEKAVKDCVHRIYWEKLKNDVTKDPPDYSNAFSTLLDIKTVSVLLFQFKVLYCISRCIFSKIFSTVLNPVFADDVWK